MSTIFVLPEECLKLLLLDIRSLIPDEEFCGVGVIIHISTTGLPIAPLCSTMTLPVKSTLAEQIAVCSFASSACHDGFQLISSDWELTHRNQYFAPFIKDSIPLVDNVGARYMSAKFGSSLESVLCTGLLNDRDGCLVFVNGELV